MLDSGCSILEKSFTEEDADLLATKMQKMNKNPSEITLRYLTGQADCTDLLARKGKKCATNPGEITFHYLTGQAKKMNKKALFLAGGKKVRATFGLKLKRYSRISSLCCLYPAHTPGPTFSFPIAGQTSRK